MFISCGLCGSFPLATKESTVTRADGRPEARERPRRATEMLRRAATGRIGGNAQDCSREDVVVEPVAAREASLRQAHHALVGAWAAAGARCLGPRDGSVTVFVKTVVVFWI